MMKHSEATETSISRTMKKLNQREILMTLVQDNEGVLWARNRTGWNIQSGILPCYWEGILCDPLDKKTVVGISMPKVKLIAKIPSELGLLKELKEIDLSQNALYGPIPKEIAKLPKLESIDLSNNQLTGLFPVFVSPILKSIRMNDNMISGRLSIDMGKRQKHLVNLELVHNQITGPIPSSLSSMSNLDTLSISENKFSGTIPSALGDIRTLRYLYLDHNELQGTIPPSLSRFDSPLAEIWLHENQLTGTIPAELSNLLNLFNFYIDGNKITGSVPNELCRAELNEDFFENSNALNNDDDDDAFDDDDDDDAFDRDYCQSVACPVGFVAPMGVYPCEECPNKRINPYLGRVGQCIDFKDSDVLFKIWNTMNGPHWKGIHQPWEGDDICSFTGITCDRKNNVIGIELKKRGLTGRIPDEIGFLQYLRFLNLSENDITGYIPSDLRWAPLETLDLSGNQLKGIVPLSLCEKEGVNRNGDDGKFSCENIGCKTGFFSPTGMSGASHQCTPCMDGLSYLASKKCLPPPHKQGFHIPIEENTTLTTKAIFFVSTVATLLVFGFIRFVQRRRSQAATMPGHFALHNLDVGDADSVAGSYNIRSAEFKDKLPEYELSSSNVNSKLYDDDDNSDAGDVEFTIT